MPSELTADAVNIANILRTGDTVIWSQGPSEPLSLTEAMVAQRKQVGRFRALLGSSYSRTFEPSHADSIEFVGLGAVGRTRKLLEAGVLQVIPCHLSQFGLMMRNGDLKVDVVFLQLSQDSSGAYSYGSTCSYMPDALRHARIVVAEINDQAPFTASSEPIDASRIDFVVRVSRPLLEVPSRPWTEEDNRIAKHAVSLVEDGATLQIGIGTLPDAILSELRDHRDLGIHSGVIGDSVVDLIKRGVVNNSRKMSDRGVSVTGGLFGTKVLSDFAHHNPAIRVDPVSYTNDLRVLSALPRLTTINSTIEIDLFGQVNSEIANNKYLGTIGGLTDFVRGAQIAEGGRSIIAMPARVSADGSSRIVPALSSGLVTAARADTDYVVTEFGIAALRGQTVNERARRLIEIAHPDDRERLARAWADIAR
jgi:acyl-CoA hydrolase